MENLQFGPDQSMTLKEPLDTWLTAGLRDFAVPEASGSSARVFKLEFPPLTGDYANYPAIKIMRPDKKAYAKPLFINETRCPNDHIPGKNRLCGEPDRGSRTFPSR